MPNSTSVVYAVSTLWVNRTTQIVRGEVWDSDDPIVRAHPEHFSDDADSAGVLRRSVPQTTTAAVTESATAAPGERRNRTGFRG